MSRKALNVHRHSYTTLSGPLDNNVVLGCGGVQFRAGPTLFVISFGCMHGLAEFNYVASQCESSLVYMCWRKMSAQENTRPTFSHPIANPFKYSSTITYVILESQESELCLHIYTHIHIHIHIHTYTYTHTYIRTYVRTYIHTYIHTYIQ